MKRGIYICGCIVMTVLFTVLLVTMYGKTERRKELNHYLDTAVEKSVENAAEERYSDEEMTADFIESVAAVLDTSSDIQVEIMKADAKKGILSVRVTEIYEMPNGKTGKERLAKTAVFETYQKKEKKTYPLNFFYSKEDLKEKNTRSKIYKISEGEMPVVPKDFYVDGKKVVGWKDEFGNEADFLLPVTEERSYYALY